MSYIQYGPEWKKQISLLTKQQIIDMFAKVASQQAMKIQDLETEKEIILGNKQY